MGIKIENQTLPIDKLDLGAKKEEDIIALFILSEYSLSFPMILPVWHVNEDLSIPFAYKPVFADSILADNNQCTNCTFLI